MGSFLSTTHRRTLPPPVQTRNELLQRYSHRLAVGPRGISKEQRYWFDVVFNTFCSQSVSTEYWSEGNLKDFMQCSLPPDITPFLVDAVPILHRTLLRMGSFPYQNDPEKLLVLGVLRTACILFNKEPENLAGGHPLLVIIFQSMAGLDLDKAQDNTKPKPRDENDDYHLKEALSMAKNRCRDPNNPRVWLPGPENPPFSHFPSSWSKNFDQSIPTLEFRSFLRLMIFLNMYHSHMETRNIASLHLQVEKVTNCMLAAFQPSAAGIIWNHFSQVIENHMPTLFRGIYLLLSPFIGMMLPSQEGFLSADKIQAILKDASIRSVQRKPPSANILSPAVLSQIDIILPEDILPQNISLLWSRRGDQLDLNTLVDQIPIQTPSILLVSGKSENQDVIFGLFEPKEPEDKLIQPFMVQLAPLHRVFRPLRRTTKCSCSILLDQARGTLTLTCQLFQSEHENQSVSPGHHGSEQCIAHLVVSGNQGHFTLSNDTSADKHFLVDAMELLKMDLLEDCGYSTD